MVGDAALLGVLAAALYRRRAGTKIKGAQAIAPQRAGTYAFAAVAAPVARARGFAGRVAVELLFRVRKNPVLAIASAGLFVLSMLGAQRAHHWVVAGAILLPLFWIRAFDDALRPRSLDEALRKLRESQPLVKLLGEAFVSAFTIVKEAEYEVFLQVISSWEREHLLLNV